MINKNSKRDRLTMKNKKILTNGKLLSFGAWLFCFAIMMSAQIIYQDSPWLYDCQVYWEIGEMLAESNFDFGSITGFRGYVFPLYLGFIGHLGGKKLWHIVTSAIVSAFCVCMIPKLMQEKNRFGVKELVRVCVFGLLLTILFVGTIVYPLSDIFALIMICAAVLCMKKSLSSDKKITKIIAAFFTGTFCYLAYNTRTIYMFAGFAMLIIYIYMCVKNEQLLTNKTVISRLFCTMLYICLGVVGMFAAAIPQIIMNKRNLNTFSISVPTNGLMLAQILWGFIYQRYDTYTPSLPDEMHSVPQVWFIDPAGIKILNDNGDFESWGEFIRLFLHYPIDVILMYFRHFVNYLMPCFPEVYITALNSSKWVWGILGFTVFFLTGFVILKKCIEIPKNILYFIPIITPGLLIIPGAVEYRFSLPIYCFALCLLCFNTNWEKVKKEIIASKWSTAFMYLITGLMVFSIWSQMLASERITPLLF